MRYVRQLGEQLPVNTGMWAHLIAIVFADNGTVRIPVDFIRLAKGRPPLKSAPSFSSIVWNDDIPRKAISEDGVTMVVSFPKLVKQRGVVSVMV